eukprot:gnl/Dysnectes_brevis/2108_a2445_972.p2 GENE.gnl/Dysnectes_brevis/2108_a2445_972~~gnl/Dysnectes_brevis/2108_a2445_972.p2  ORF type:complete len:474 (+),score=123.52 gnl/Dysnectes_brevis/2108_a2445_972:1768-3189(+)
MSELHKTVTKPTDPTPAECSEKEAKPISFWIKLVWALLDVASSSYITIIVTAVYSPFFMDYIVPSSFSAPNTVWSLALLIPALISLFSNPFIGIIIDLRGSKTYWLRLSVILLAISCFLLSLAKTGQMVLAISFIVLAQLSFNHLEMITASFLNDVSTPAEAPMISGIGWAAGYIGALVLLLATTFIVSADPSEEDMYVNQNLFVCVIVSISVVVFGLPGALVLKPKRGPEGDPTTVRAMLALTLRRMKDTLKLLKEFVALKKFFIAFFVYYGALDIVVKYAGIIASDVLQLDSGQLALFFVLLQVSATLGALVFGTLEKRYGSYNIVIAVLIWWIVTCVGITVVAAATEYGGTATEDLFAPFLIIVTLGGVGMGSLQSSSRAIISLIAPPDRVSQCFGLWSLVMRLSSLFSLVYGLLSDATGMTVALVFVSLLFAVGLFLFARSGVDAALCKIQNVERVEEKVVVTEVEEQA